MSLPYVYIIIYKISMKSSHNPWSYKYCIHINYIYIYAGRNQIIFEIGLNFLLNHKNFSVFSKIYIYAEVYMNIYNRKAAPVKNESCFYLFIDYISIQSAYIQVLTRGIDSSRHVDTPRYITFFLIPFGSRDTVSRSWYCFQNLDRF